MLERTIPPPPQLLEPSLWLNLPASHRKRLIWILTQMLEAQLAVQLSQEQDDEDEL
jgi:hypothetical protein